MSAVTFAEAASLEDIHNGRPAPVHLRQAPSPRAERGDVDCVVSALATQRPPIPFADAESLIDAQRGTPISGRQRSVELSDAAAVDAILARVSNSIAP